MDWISNSSNNKFYLATKESSLTDSEYRYKIDPPIFFIGGKQKNKTTLFENSESFAKDIGVPSLFFCKYIANKISCPLNFDKDKNCYGFKGDYSNDIILQHLNDFIKIYILCPGCDYPEIDLKLDSKKNINQICRSCGTINIINAKYMDKTYDFIEKQLK